MHYTEKLPKLVLSSNLFFFAYLLMNAEIRLKTCSLNEMVK